MASVISQLFRKISSLRVGKSRQIENENESAQLNKVENILMEIQKILIWDDPVLSCCCITSVNVVFWLIIYLDFKFYGIIFMAMLILSLEQLFMDHIAPALNKNEQKFQASNTKFTPSVSVPDKNEPNSQDSSLTSNSSPNPRIFTVSEIVNCMKTCQVMVLNTYHRTKLFRQRQPGMFCILTCLCFLMLNVIGRSISGVMSLYILLMLIMTVPGVFFHCLPSVISSSNFTYSSHKESNSDDEDEEVKPYLPETTPETVELLRLAGDSLQLNKEDDDDDNDEEEASDLLLDRLSARTSDTTESVCSKMSLYPESSFMPSPEHSMDFENSNLDFDLPSGNLGRERNDINFQSKHFDGESSDEEEFAKDLILSENLSKKTKEENETGILPAPAFEQDYTSRGINFLQSLLNLKHTEKSDETKVMKTKNTKRSDRESSSDTDSFEMISEEDM